MKKFTLSEPWIGAALLAFSMLAPAFAAPPQTRPAALFEATKFGAVGDGKVDDTQALQKALDACAAGGGGVVRLARGKYNSGALTMKSKTILELDEGAEILGVDDLKAYPLTKVRWEGEQATAHAALINAQDAEDIVIRGKGRIAGSGAGSSAAPAGPRVIELISCRNVKIEGLTINNKGRWTIHPLFCKDVELTDLQVITTGHNSDGCDPDSSINVAIRRCTFSNGDDCIAIKSGRNQAGKRDAKPCENITIEDCTFAKGHGAVVLGSEVSGDIRKVTVKNCRSDGTDRGIRLKTRRGRGGVVEGVSISGFQMKNVGEAIVVTMNHQTNAGTAPIEGPDGITEFRNIRIEEVRVESCKTAGSISGDASKPVRGLVLKNITLPEGKNLRLTHVEKPEVTNVTAGHADGVSNTTR